MNLRKLSFLQLCLFPRTTSFALYPTIQEHKWWGIANLQQVSTSENELPTEPPPVLGVVAPLKHMGHYIGLSLQFPNLKTPNKPPISLDFILDTGANVNSLDSQIVKKLALQSVFNETKKGFPIVGSDGIGSSAQVGDLFLLGDCQLAGLPPEQSFTFMTNLTAVGLPRSSPKGDGLLGINFFLSFPAGVEIDWYGTDGDPPTIIFYFAEELFEDQVLKSKSNIFTKVQLEKLPSTQVLSLTINVNGTDIPALLDTGSPITVLNKQAAEKAGIATSSSSHFALSNILPYLKKQQQIGDEVVTIGGVTGGQITLHRSKMPVTVRAGNVSFGERNVYVGDMPCFSFLNSPFANFSTVTSSSPLQQAPAALLGLDCLKQTFRIVLRATKNELWFEEIQRHDAVPGE